MLPMPKTPDPTERARELAAALHSELDRLHKTEPGDADLRAMREFAGDLGGKLTTYAAARGYIDPPYPG